MVTTVHFTLMIQNFEIFKKRKWWIEFYIMPYTEFFIRFLTELSALTHIPVVWVKEPIKRSENWIALSEKSAKTTPGSVLR